MHVTAHKISLTGKNQLGNVGMCWTGDLDPITKEPFPEIQYVPRPVPADAPVLDQIGSKQQKHIRRSAGVSFILHICTASNRLSNICRN